MTTDVEMKDTEASEAPKEQPESGAEAPSLQSVLDANIQLIRKAVAARETRLLFGRILRQTATVRSQITAEALNTFFETVLAEGSSARSYLLRAVSGDEGGMDVDPPAGEPAGKGAQPEETLYCYFLLCQLLVDGKQNDKLLQVAEAALAYIRRFNRRTLDALAARIYFYYSLAYERAGKLQNIRSALLELHCTAVLRHDEAGQEVLLNLLLRNYLHYSLYEQAEKLRAQAPRPDTSRSNQQFCRYLYYLGRIRAVQLEYTEAKECLLQASRKAPAVARGFAISVTKWLTVVRLLLGEVPERSEFQAKGMQAALRPYLELTQAVRNGDVAAFNRIAAAHATTFVGDRIHNLINRLHHNVIRAALRRMSVAYSRISLKDVAAKLGLKGVADVESIVAKTIRDGSISATIDHEGGCLCSRELGDAYVTAEPQAAFHARTAFCMDIHNEAVRAMRYDAAEAPAVAEAVPQTQVEEVIAAAFADAEDDF